GEVPGFADTHGRAGKSTRAPVAVFETATLHRLPVGEEVGITTLRHSDFARLWVYGNPGSCLLDSLIDAFSGSSPSCRHLRRCFQEFAESAHGVSNPD